MKQVFAVHDIAVVIVLIGLEALLSIDNCVVLTVLVQHLPYEQRRKALLYGVGGAFVFRFIFVLLATTLMSFWWIQALGASYLFLITFKHFKGGGEDQIRASQRSLLQTIVAVELTDVAFAGDSVMAGVAMVKGAPEKLWSVYLGGILGIFTLRMAISALSRLVERYPKLVDVGYSCVSWVGLRLLLVSINKLTANTSLTIPTMADSIFWTGMGIISISGGWIASKKPSAESIPSIEEELEASYEDETDLMSATTV